MFEIIFIVTFGVVGLTTIKFIGLIFGNSISLPSFVAIGEGPISDIKPDTWFIFYPAFYYQLSFWISKLGVLT